jgi:hypothetical protein
VNPGGHYLQARQDAQLQYELVELRLGFSDAPSDQIREENFLGVIRGLRRFRNDIVFSEHILPLCASGEA